MLSMNIHKRAVMARMAALEARDAARGAAAIMIAAKLATLRVDGSPGDPPSLLENTNPGTQAAIVKMRVNAARWRTMPPEELVRAIESNPVILRIIAVVDCWDRGDNERAMVSEWARRNREQLRRR